MYPIFRIAFRLILELGRIGKGRRHSLERPTIWMIPDCASRPMRVDFSRNKDAAAATAIY